MYKGYIYRHWIVNDKSINKSYIGQTKQSSVEVRWGNNGSGYKPQKDKEPTKFWKSISKYGWDSFTHDILLIIECKTEEELVFWLNQWEMYYIEKYDSFHNGYNSTLGGEGTLGYTPTLEQQQKRLLKNEIKRIKDCLPQLAILLSNLKLTKHERFDLLEKIENNFNRLKAIDVDNTYSNWHDYLEEYLVLDVKDFLKVNTDFGRYYKKVKKQINVTVEQLIGEIYFTEVVVTPKYNSSEVKMTYEQSIKYGEKHDWINMYNSCSQAKGIVGCYACKPFENEFKVHQAIMLDIDTNYPLIYKNNGCRNKNYVRFAHEPQDYIFDFNDLYDYDTIKEEVEIENKNKQKEEEKSRRERELAREKQIEELKKPHYHKIRKEVLKEEYRNEDVYSIWYNEYNDDKYYIETHWLIMTRREYSEQFGVDLFEVGITDGSN